jgi:hypothetical protein
MFTHLRDRFARIPEWARALGEAAPAPYFARKILTPDLLDNLLGALVPTVKEALGGEAAPAARATGPGPGSPLLQGQTSLLPLPHLLRELAASGRTGRIRLEHPSRTTQLFLRRGRIVLATHDDPEEYLRQSTEDLHGVPGAELDKAKAEQRGSGKPLFVALAEASRLPGDNLGTVLYQHGKRALLAAIEAGPGAFDWQDAKELPGYVESHGRPLSLDQIQLERLRAVDDWAQVELHVDSLDLVFRRVEGFGELLASFELTDNERRVLTLVGNRNSVRQIIERSALTPFEVFHCLFRLGEVGLITRRDETTAAPRGDGRAVAILEPDREGVKEPLARLLARRGRPLSLIDIPTPDDLIPLCLRERPQVLVLNVSSGFDALAAAHRVRGTLEISDIALVAVADREPGRLAEELSRAGFDAVLVKPFLFTDIERLLAA